MSQADHTAILALPGLASGSSAAPARRVRVFGPRALLALSWLAPLLLVAVWEILAQTGYVTPQVLPAPSKVVRTAWRLATTGSLLNDLGTSLPVSYTHLTLPTNREV